LSGDLSITLPKLMWNLNLVGLEEQKILKLIIANRYTFRS